MSVFVFYFVKDMHAILAIGFWFLFQIVYGIGLLGRGTGGRGIAYGAHIDGFIS